MAGVASTLRRALRHDDAAQGAATTRPVLPHRILDGAIALCVALLGAVSGLGATHQHEHVPAAAIGVLTAMGLVLYPRRRFPGEVLAAEAAGVIALAAMRTSLEGAFIAVLISSYSAAVYGSRRLGRILAVAAAVAVVGLGIPHALNASGWFWSRLPAPTLLAAAGAWLVGLVIRKQFDARNAHAAALAERAELLAAQQEERARRATLAERLRIARELHDIVAHHLSVIVIQAQGAQRMTSRDPARAQTAMADVERTGRTALEEMRRLLGLLRTGEPGAGELDAGESGHAAAEAGAYVPPLRLADVDDLAERLRGAGLPVTILRQGEPRSIPEDVELTVYRIIQEALTNVLKHAGPAEATVRLEFGEPESSAGTECGEFLDVTVTDDGRGAAAGLDGPAAPGAGRGTAGMRERVAALGGTLTAGPRPGGGFRVHARIPL